MVPEPGGVGGVGGVECRRALGLDLGGGAVVHRGGGVQADAGMAVLVVVVVEEHGAEGAGFFEVEPKLPGKAGQYLRVLKLASE